MKSIKKYFLHKKEFSPQLKFRYATGLGDVITAILHSKMLGFFTYMITGKLNPCHKCNNRRIAINTIMPFKLWRFWFKTNNEVQKSIIEEYEKDGAFFIPENGGVRIIPKSQKDLDDLSITSYKEVEKQFIVKEPVKDVDKNHTSDWILINNSSTEYGNVLVEINIYNRN